MKYVIILIVALGLMGCGSTGAPRSKNPMKLTASSVPVLPEGVWTDQMCYDLMKERDDWLFAGEFLSGLGGVGGITAASVPENEAGDWPQWTAGTVSVISGAAGVASILVYKSKSDTFEIYCTVEVVNEVKP